MESNDNSPYFVMNDVLNSLKDIDSSIERVARALEEINKHLYYLGNK